MAIDQPIDQQAYDPAWPAAYLAARAELAPVFGPEASIHHIGSTAVPGLSAKNIVDLLVAQPALLVTFEMRDALEDLGYEERFGNAGVNALFVKNIPPTNVHIALAGSDYARDRLTFRDYLRQHGDRRDAYAALKGEAAAANPGDPVAYAASKVAFVVETLELAAVQGGESEVALDDQGNLGE